VLESSYQTNLGEKKEMARTRKDRVKKWSCFGFSKACIRISQLRQYSKNCLRLVDDSGDDGFCAKKHLKLF